MKAKCLVCGNLFEKSPSDNVVTCSSECSKQRRAALLKGHNVSDEARAKISTHAKARGFTENLSKGTPVAMQSPKAGRFDTNSSAKSWVLLSPDRRTFPCTNLKNWVRNNINLFNMELNEQNVNRIASGFRTIKRNIKNNHGAQTYKGWTIIEWDDRKNIEKEKQHNERKD